MGNDNSCFVKKRLFVTLGWRGKEEITSFDVLRGLLNDSDKSLFQSAGKIFLKKCNSVYISGISQKLQAFEKNIFLKSRKYKVHTLLQYQEPLSP